MAAAVAQRTSEIRGDIDPPPVRALGGHPRLLNRYFIEASLKDPSYAKVTQQSFMGGGKVKAFSESWFSIQAGKESGASDLEAPRAILATVLRVL
jgi:hypothetical protein